MAQFRPFRPLRYRVSVRLAFPLVLLLPLACAEPPDPDAGPGRGVLLIAIDALRYDHTSFAGYDRDTTPKLASLFAKQGIIFEDAWSPGPSLLPAHIALLTGCDPTIARQPDVVLSDGSMQPPIVDWYVPDSAPTLADEFLAAGWRTAAFVDHLVLEDRRGVDRGFRDFQEVGPWSENAQYLTGVAPRFFDWLDGLNADEDWFAYVHFNDLEAIWSERWSRQGPDLIHRFEPRPELDHVPPVSIRSPAYFALPPERLLEGSPTLGEYEVHYDTALWWIDNNVRRMIDMLSDQGYLRETTVVITGTFGVGFGEAGLVVDSGTLSPADLHVPMLLRPAQGLGVSSGRRVDQLVTLADVAPTLLTLHGIQAPRGMHGVSLTPMLRGKGELTRDTVYASHSITEGFSVITEDLQYAWWEPRSRGVGSVLARSWYGISRQGDGRGTRVLVPRDLPASAWLSSGIEGDVSEAAELHERGRIWYDDLESARQVLNPSSWNEHLRGAAVVEDLRARGLIGDTP